MLSFPDDNCIISENFAKGKEKISTKSDWTAKKMACHDLMNLL